MASVFPSQCPPKSEYICRIILTVKELLLTKLRTLIFSSLDDFRAEDNKFPFKSSLKATEEEEENIF